MRQALGRFSVTAAIVAAAIASQSTVASAQVIPASGPSASFELSGSHGYRLQFQVDPGGASIAVSGRRGSRDYGANTSYMSRRAHTTPDHFHAGLGRFGLIDLAFHPKGKVAHRPAPGPCAGGRETIRSGVFVGTVRFRGENGYTEVTRHRVRGKVSTSAAQTCPLATHRGSHRGHRHGHRRHRAPLDTVLSAASSNGTSLTAVSTPGEPRPIILVSNFERAQGLSISHDAFTPDPPGSFSFDRSLNSATLTPPAPFAGSAIFERPDQFTTRWAGDLSVSFPGDPDVPLTGRGFDARLYHRRSSSGDGISIVVVSTRSRAVR